MKDPYQGCEDTCTHDLGRGVLIEELIGWDGPYPVVWAQLTAPTTIGEWMSVLMAQRTADELVRAP